MTTRAGATPTRTCVGCGRRHPKSGLRRVVAATGAALVLDARQRLPGRGAYLCGPGCLRAAVKRRALQRALRLKGELNVSVLEADLQLTVIR